jgi:non-specific serine/threonine protein kinase
LSATFRKEGEYWVIGYKAAAFRLKDRIGLRYLSVMLSNPGREFLAIDLAAAVQSGGSTPAADRSPPYGPPLGRDKEGGFPSLGGPEPYFDEPARRAYGQRLRDLRATLEEAQEFNDRERASRAQAEIDFVTDELRRGIGLDRRARPTGSPVERARVSVTHAIKDALRAIARNDPALSRYLAGTIKTGTYCCYSPDPNVAVQWEL